MNFKNLLKPLLYLLLGSSLSFGTIAYTTYGVPQDNDDLIVVTAPAEVEVGELVVLDASESKASSFKWIVKPETKNFRVDADGKHAVFSEGKPGTYTFYVAGAAGNEVDADTVEVVVTGDAPTPGPQPLTFGVKDWVKLVKTADLRSEADALAASFQGVSAQIAAGVLSTPDQIIKSTAIANRGALGNSLDAWQPFSEKLRAKLNELADQGKLQTPDDHVKVWTQISNELAEVAKGK